MTHRWSKKIGQLIYVLDPRPIDLSFGSSWESTYIECALLVDSPFYPTLAYYNPSGLI